MAIVRRDYFGDLDPFENRLRRMFRNFTRDWPSFDEPSVSGWNPSVDIYETQNDLVVRAELPGMEQK
ncbi:MAG: hypothetical protein HY646_17960, partial [Acidobacteria bacterium]|nr:hypothetical protein [Acidobacteriota bacterium]